MIANKLRRICVVQANELVRSESNLYDARAVARTKSASICLCRTDRARETADAQTFRNALLLPEHCSFAPMRPEEAVKNELR